MNTSRYNRCIHAIALLAFVMAPAVVGVQTSNAYSQILSPPPKPLTPEISAPIRTLLTDDWKRAPKNEAASKSTFEKARVFTDDLLVTYTINRIRHNRISEAKLAAQELTVRHPDNLDGWILRTWLNTLTDDFDAALINIRSLKKKFDQTKNLAEPTKQKIYKRLGRLIGYMQGPVSDRVNNDLRDETIQFVTAGVKPELVKLFNGSRNKVLKEYGDLTKSQADKTQVELVKIKASNDAEAVALERQIKLLEQSESQQTAEKQRIRDESARQISAIERQGSSAELEISRINTNLRTTELDLFYLHQDLNFILNQPPGRRFSTFNLQNQIRNAQLSANALRLEGIQATNQLNSLRTQLVAAQRNSTQRLNDLEREIKRVNGAKRRNLAKLTKLAKGPKVADGKRQSMQSRVNALRTYDDLPLELYRQDILDQLTN